MEIFSFESEQNTAFTAYGEHCYFAITDAVFHGDMLASAGGFGRSALLFRMEAGNTAIENFGFSQDGSEAVLLLKDGSAIVGKLFDSLDTMIDSIR